MEQAEAITRLSELHDELEMAARDQDWKDIALIDQDIFAIAKIFSREQRSAKLAEQFNQLRETYQQVIAEAEARREELKAKMHDMRNQRGAIAGYHNVLAASSQNIRSGYDAR